MKTLAAALAAVFFSGVAVAQAPLPEEGGSFRITMRGKTIPRAMYFPDKILSHEYDIFNYHYSRSRLEVQSWAESKRWIASYVVFLRTTCPNLNVPFQMIDEFYPADPSTYRRSIYYAIELALRHTFREGISAERCVTMAVRLQKEINEARAATPPSRPEPPTAQPPRRPLPKGVLI